MRTRLLAQGIIDIAEHGSKGADTLFKSYLNLALPFFAKEVGDKDEEMKKAMAREVSKGAIVFNVTAPNPLAQRAKQMSLPDSFREKLAQRKQRNG